LYLVFAFTIYLLSFMDTVVWS